MLMQFVAKFGKASSIKIKGFETRSKMMWKIKGLYLVSILTYMTKRNVTYRMQSSHTV